MQNEYVDLKLLWGIIEFFVYNRSIFKFIKNIFDCLWKLKLNFVRNNLIQLKNGIIWYDNS